MKNILLLVLFVSVCGVLSAADRSYPEAKKRVPPVYTKEILAKHISGVVVLDFYVEQDGSVIEAKAKTSPAPELSEAAIACIKKWKFTPATSNGKPIRTHMQMPIVFDPK